MSALRRKLDACLAGPMIAVLSRLPNRPGAQGPIKKLLVIKFAAVGDTILLGTVMRALRKARPDLEIHWLASSINLNVVKTFPEVNRAWLSPKTPGPALGRTIIALRRERFDAVIDFEQWARMTAVVAWATGAPRRFGFDTPGHPRAGLFTRALPKNARRHELDDFYELLQLALPVEADRTLGLNETSEGREELAKRCPALASRKTGPRVLLHPGCGADGLPREWPLDRFQELGRWLQDRYRAELWISGGPEEKEKGRLLAAGLRGQSFNVAGMLSWPATFSLVRSMDLVVSGNTGVMHVAAAFQKPQVALHGPTDSVRWGPLNPQARVIQTDCPRCPCLVLGFEYHSRDQSCMARISLAQVQAAVDALAPSAFR